MTGTRPNRSIERPAGNAVSACAVNTIAGPSPSSPLTPVIETNVIDETAAASWRKAELTAIVPERSAVFRAIGRAVIEAVIGAWPRGLAPLLNRVWPH
jgi:hypothetical protein